MFPPLVVHNSGEQRPLSLKTRAGNYTAEQVLNSHKAFPSFRRNIYLSDTSTQQASEELAFFPLNFKA